jgi:ubiquinone biosynthesis protein COQ9
MTTHTDPGDLRDRIVDTALALAEQRSWETVRLHDVAAALGIGLEDIRRQFREKEDLVDAWFDRADRAMLEDAATPGFLVLSTRQRLHRVIMHWLTALSPHRRVTRQMILGKLEPGHLHIQIPGLLRISRTVQWMREAAQRDTASMAWRALEETATTSIYLMTFVHWMTDDSPQSARTAEFLDRRLKEAETLAHIVSRPQAARPAADHKPH